MTLEEKIEVIRKASMEEARKDGNKIIQEYKQGIDQIYEDHKEVALRQSNLSIKTKENDARLQLNQAIANVQTKLKREEGKCQTKLKQQLFQQIKDQLVDFMKTSSYDELLIAYIEKVKNFADKESYQILISPNDKEKIKTLEAKTNTFIQISDEDFIGGIRAVLKDRQILIDHSFSSALTTEYENFQFTGGDFHE
ncbi:MAG: V-type ATP synthase subunit E [Anaerostipes sp.]|nr:V-type ATP synthase subunit E [Anaerostipes sp.]